MVLQSHKNIKINKSISDANSAMYVLKVSIKDQEMVAVKGGIIMTANQVSYARYREEQRHNLATEPIELYKAQAAMRSADASMAHAHAAFAQVTEMQRHNQVQEDIGWSDFYSQDALREAQASATLTQAEAAKDRAQAAIVSAKTAADKVALGFEELKQRKKEFKENVRHNQEMEAIGQAQVGSSILNSLTKPNVMRDIGGFGK